MNKKLSADLPVGRQGTAKKCDFLALLLIACPQRTVRQALCIALRIDLSASTFLN